MLSGSKSSVPEPPKDAPPPLSAAAAAMIAASGGSVQQRPITVRLKKNKIGLGVELRGMQDPGWVELNALF